MKKVQKQTGLFIAAVMLCTMLAGCKAEPDPNSGVYEGVSASMAGFEMDVSEVYENGVSFELKDGGKCVANLDGDTAKLKWKTDGDSIHFEGGGVELDGTIGNGDLKIINIMDTGMDLYLHCDELLHADEKSSDTSALSGSVLERLRDAKAGKDVYGGKTASVSSTDNGDDISGDSGSAIGGDMFINPDYESVTGEKYHGGGAYMLVPEGWTAFKMSDNQTRVIKGGTSADDYMNKASILIEWHPDASGSIDSSNMDDPIEISDLKLGDHNYNGVYGIVPGDWYSYMFIDEQDDGYILVSLSIPPDDNTYMLDADVQAIIASVRVK